MTAKNNTLIVVDTIAKTFAINIETGKLYGRIIIFHHLTHKLKYLKINFMLLIPKIYYVAFLLLMVKKYGITKQMRLL